MYSETKEAAHRSEQPAFKNKTFKILLADKVIAITRIAITLIVITPDLASLTTIHVFTVITTIILKA